MTTALVIVDMLKDFYDGTLANPAAKDIVGPIGSLATAARGADDWFVVYANDAHLATDPELQVFPPHAMVGTPGGAVIDELAPGPLDIVIPKRYYSAFTETDLDDVLAENNVDRVVLTGQHTDCCVRHTSYDAFARGYQIVVCPDATTVYEPLSDEPVLVRQQRALDYLRTYYGVQLEPSIGVL